MLLGTVQRMDHRIFITQVLESGITSVFIYSFRIVWCFFFLFIYNSLYSLKRADSTKRNKNEHRERTGLVLIYWCSDPSSLDHLSYNVANTHV